MEGYLNKPRRKYHNEPKELGIRSKGCTSNIDVELTLDKPRSFRIPEGQLQVKGNRNSDVKGGWYNDLEEQSLNQFFSVYSTPQIARQRNRAWPVLDQNRILSTSFWRTDLWRALLATLSKVVFRSMISSSPLPSPPAFFSFRSSISGCPAL